MVCSEFYSTSHDAGVYERYLCNALLSDSIDHRGSYVCFLPQTPGTSLGGYCHGAWILAHWPCDFRLHSFFCSYGEKLELLDSGRSGSFDSRYIEMDLSSAVSLENPCFRCQLLQARSCGACNAACDSGRGSACTCILGSASKA